MLVGTWHRYRRSACVEILHGKFSDCSSPPRNRTLTVSVIRQICTWLPLCINVWIDIVKRARCAIKRRFCVFFFSFSFFLFVWFLSLSSSLFLSVSGKYKVSNLPSVLFSPSSLHDNAVAHLLIPHVLPHNSAYIDREIQCIYIITIRILFAVWSTRRNARTSA